MERKKFLRTSIGLLGAAGIMQACKKDDEAATAVTDPAATQTSTTANSSACRVSPSEVEGPYPYPGGEINNPLNRSDVRESQTGVPLSLALNVVNVNAACAAVANARVDIWACNKDGYYSGYGNQNGQSFVGQVWLRGYQATDADGKCNFITIYPGWYNGRATHIHYEVFVGGSMKKTGQFAFPESISNSVHASYGVGNNTTSNASDGIFGNSTTDLANETLSITGSIAAGFAGSYTIGIQL